MNREDVLSAVPRGLRSPVIEAYENIVRNFAEGRWEPSELNGGKFCEAVYTILKGALDGNFSDRPTKPRNMVEACKALEQYPGDTSRVGDRSLRVLLPRALPYLYEIRNNRGVGHVGGDVDPNQMDAATVLSTASWILAELVRIFHEVTPSEARGAIESLVTRRHPLVWKDGSLRRVLDSDLSKTDQTLVLLYAEPSWAKESDIRSWVEYANSSHFRTKILLPLHNSRYIEYDSTARQAKLTPKGVSEVEERLLKIPG